MDFPLGGSGELELILVWSYRAEGNTKLRIKGSSSFVASNVYLEVQSELSLLYEH